MIRNRAYAKRAVVVGALVALFMLLVVGTLWAAEYVVNGGFESGSDGWIFGCDWGDPSDCSVDVSMDESHSGSWSAKLDPFFDMGGAHSQQYISITPGVVYTFSFWSMFVPSGTTTIPANVTIESGNESVFFSDLPTDNNVWIETTGSFSFDISDPGPYSLLFIIRETDDEEMIYIDDVSIGEGESIPPSNDESTNASTCLMLLLIKLSVAMVVFFAVVSLGMWLGQINIF